MASEGCNSPGCVGDCKTIINMPCEVCTLVHGDNKVKRVFYCKVCAAYICCEKCRYDLINRGLAATIRAGMKAKEFIKGITDEKAEITNRRTRKRSKSDDISG